jgi:hypothetical protein
MKSAMGLVFGVVLLQACASPTAFSSVASRELVAVRVRYDGYPDQVVRVEGSYGLLIVWRSPAADDVLFCLFDAVQGRRAVTSSWEEFLRAVRELPDGVEVQHFNQCCAPWDYAMPDSKWESLSKVIKQKHWTWREDPTSGIPVTIVCTCESRSVEFAP